MSLLDLVDLLQSVVDGLLFGAVYAVIGIGFTLVFGVMHKLNLAYAAASLAAAYLSLLLPGLLPGTPPLLLLAAAGVAGAVLGACVYALCFHFVAAANPLVTLMTSLGMLLLVDELIVHTTNGVPKNFPPLFGDWSLEIGTFLLRGDLLFVFVAAILLMLMLVVVLFHTRLGLATRAVSQQPTAAQLCGIGLTRTNGLTFILTGLLGGIAGALAGSAIGVLSPLLSLPLTIKGLIVTVVGGLGSIPGAVIAGLLVGSAENLAQYLRGVSERDIYVMLMLFAFLVFRPGGLFAPPQGRD
jgi:branched-chain amino acid transport system permease protein